MAVTLRPITRDDRTRVGTFLHTNLNERVSADAWARSLEVPWEGEQPNGGFMLVDDGELVGAHLAFYSERLIDGRVERFCNLGAWCVAETHRFHALRLLKALLAQDGYHFTDLSPSGNVIKLNERLQFQSFDTSSVLVPNLPRPWLPGRVRLITRPEEIERTLTGESLHLYRDHARAAASRHVVLARGDEWCYVAYRHERRRDLPLFASLLHVSDPACFTRLAPRLRTHLLRRGILATFVEDRLVARQPRLAFRLSSPRRKMFRSSHLRADQIDYFYSELACVAW